MFWGGLEFKHLLSEGVLGWFGGFFAPSKETLGGSKTSLQGENCAGFRGHISPF